MSDLTPAIPASRSRQLSLVLMTWTHAHTCDITSCYRTAPSYAPLYIPTSIGAPNLLALLSSDVNIVAELKTCQGVEVNNNITIVHGTMTSTALLPVHPTVQTKQHQNVNPLLVTLRKCKRGNVVFTFDPSFPLPN